MEKFYSSIEQFSFGSTFRPLTIEMAHALIKAHGAWKADPSSSTSFLHAPDTHPLRQLSKIIKEAQTEKAWPHIFVRLSSRSPKDAALTSPKFNELLTHVCPHSLIYYIRCS
jgi:hypothetical protein